MKTFWILMIFINYILLKKPILTKNLNIQPNTKKCFIILPYKNLNVISIYTKNKLSKQNKIFIIQDNKNFIYNPDKEIVFKKIDNKKILICYKNNNKHFSLKNIKVKIYEGKFNQEKVFEDEYNLSQKKEILKNFSELKMNLGNLNKKSNLLNTLLSEK